MKKRALSLLLIGTVIAGILTGCGSTAETAATNEATESESEADTQAKADTEAETDTEEETETATETAGEEPITIKACLATGMTGAVNNFAIEKGLYKELGIEFDSIEWSSNDEVLSLIARGEIDFADGDPSSYIPGIANGVPAKLVGNMWRYSGCYWLVGNNDITSIADLKGKVVGTQGAAGGMRLSVLKMLESEGLTENDVELVANGVYQGAYATLTSGEVDATIIHNPYAALAEAEGEGHILGRAWDYIPDYYTGTLIASDRIIKEEPEKLQRVITAYYKVHEEVKNEYFDEFIAWASEQMNVDEAVMKKAVESEIDVWLDYPVIPVDRVNKTVDILHEYGWLDEKVTADGTYDNTFAEKAAEELGLEDPYK